MNNDSAFRQSSLAQRLGELPQEGAIGVAAALIDTVGPQEAVQLMVEHFGWDATMQASAALDEQRANRALYLTVQTLLST